MAKKKGYKKITGWKWFWVVGNLTIALIIFLIIWFGSGSVLESITRHGETLEVPDFQGKTLEEAEKLASDAGVRLQVTDSIYVKERRGTVDRQDPMPGSKVKKDRKIRVVMRAKGIRKVVVPNLVGYSTRQALAELGSRGLLVGTIIYDDKVPTSNNVLEQRYRGREIMPGDSVEAESTIDLVVGLSSEDCETRIPDVTGKKGTEAVRLLHNYYLNVRCKYDREVNTSEERANAVVYKQTPAPSDLPVQMGIDVTLYLRNEASEK